MELKNVNSFAAVHRGVEYEITRQAAVLDAGGVLAQETRTWDDKTSSTVVLRVKEGDADYRYFPEPDLPPLTLSAATLAAWRDALPELPAEKRARYVAGLGLSEYDAWVLADDAETARYFDAVVAAGADAKAAANWVMGDVLKEVRAAKLETVPACALSPAALAEMVTMITDGVISGKIAKGLLPELVVSGGSPAAMVEERGLKQITDAGEIGALVEGVLAANPKEVDLYRNVGWPPPRAHRERGRASTGWGPAATGAVAGWGVGTVGLNSTGHRGCAPCGRRERQPPTTSL